MRSPVADGSKAGSRWYETDSVDVASRNWETLPVATVEYAIPASFFGGERLSNILGRPALDFQGSYLKVWSTVRGSASIDGRQRSRSGLAGASEYRF